jgi:pyridoxal phosphate enzyme (YggS family)
MQGASESEEDLSVPQTLDAWRERIQRNLLYMGYPQAPYWQGVSLVAVTKYVDALAIQGAFQCGLLAMGENKAVEALAKRSLLPPEVNEAIEWHFIGSIQRNKLNKIVGHYDLIHSVDRLELLEDIASKAEVLHLEQAILLQVNASEEISKHGVTQEALPDLMARALTLAPHVKVLGLMTMAPNTEDLSVIDECFTRLRNAKTQLEKEFTVSLSHLSMGMSNDYAQGLANGATIVRIGSKLFKD